MRHEGILSRVGVLAGIMAALCAAAATGIAAPIAINNPSFEAIALGEGGFTPALALWSKGTVSPTDPNTGTFNPSAAHYPGGTVPDGLNVAISNGPTISQVLGSSLAPNTFYTLDADVGVRQDGSAPTTQAIELWAGGTMLSRTTATLPSVGTFVPATATYFASWTDPNVGQPLEIRLVKTGTPQANFDNVRLDAQQAQYVIPVNNPGFEQDATGWFTPAMTEWDKGVPPGDGNTGSWRPTAAEYPNGVPDGVQVAISNGPAFSQVLGSSLTSGIRYSLEAEVGQRAAGVGLTGYRMELAAGGTVLAQNASTTPPPPGQFQTATVQFTAPPGHANLDQPLEIRFSSLGGQPSYDSVRVLAEPLNTVAYDVPAGTPGNQAFSGPLGMDFDVNFPAQISHLGVFDDNSDGLNRTITARLYDRSTQQEVATLAFSGNDGTLLGGSRFRALGSPIALPAGFQGTIVAENYGATERNANFNAGWTTNDGGGLLSFVGSARYGTTQGAFPGTPDGGPANRYAAGTFLYGPADIVTYEVPAGTVGTQAFGGALGMDFDINTPTTIALLGVFDSGSDGLSLPITARLYDRDTRLEVASVSFTGTEGTQVGGSRFKPLSSPITLPAGFRGTIVAEGYGSAEPNGNAGSPVWTTNDHGGILAFVGGGRYAAAAGTFPGSPDTGPANRYAAGTFTAEVAPVGIGDEVVAYANPAIAGNQAFGGSLGMDFDTSTPVTISELGVFDSNADGLGLAITARLYDRDTGTELVSLAFSGADGRLVGGSRFLSLPSPVRLPAGFHGTIVAEGYGGAELNGNQGSVALGLTTHDGDGRLSFIGSRYGAAGSFPTTPDAAPANRYAAGTFIFEEHIERGTPIEMTNSSFEISRHGETGYSTTVPGWTTAGAGNYNPPPTGAFDVPVHSGEQVAFVNAGGRIYAQVDEQLAAGTLYILEAVVGNRKETPGVTDMSIALRAGGPNGPVLAWANNSNIFNIASPAEGQFSPAIMYATANRGAPIGGNLYVDLTAGGGQGIFDNIRLSKVVGRAMPVANFSFEADDVASNGGWQEGATGWTASGAGGGIFELASQIAPTDGTQSAFIRGGGSFTQNTGMSVKPGDRYILLADVGDRWSTPYGGYAIELLAGGQTLAIDSNPVALAIEGGLYLTPYLDYLVAEDDPLINEPLAIRLSALGSGTQTYFDNVRFFAVVPEPTTLALLGLGGLALLRRRRRAF